MSVRRATTSSLLGAAALAGLVACGGSADPPAVDLARFRPQPTPEQAMSVYVNSLELRVLEPDLTLYTPETRSYLASYQRYEHQLETGLRSLRAALGSMEVRRRGDRAVIRFAPRYRQTAPHFLRRGADGWMVDLVAMNQAIVFDRANEWRFKNRDHAYAFAFDD